MAVNDIYTLPPLSRNMRELADVLQAEQYELSRIEEFISQVEAQLCINSCTFLISRYEKIFAIPYNDDLSDEERIINIIAKFMTRSPATVKALEDIAQVVTHNKCTITEQNSNYQFDIAVDRSNLFLFDMQTLCNKIEELKPAHLNFAVYYEKSVALGCLVQSHTYKIYSDLQGDGYSGELPQHSFIGMYKEKSELLYLQHGLYVFENEECGIYPQINYQGKSKVKSNQIPNVKTGKFVVSADMTDNTPVGEIPNTNILGETENCNGIPSLTGTVFYQTIEYCGTDYCGEGG